MSLVQTGARKRVESLGGHQSVCVTCVAMPLAAACPAVSPAALLAILWVRVVSERFSDVVVGLVTGSCSASSRSLLQSCLAQLLDYHILPAPPICLGVFKAAHVQGRAADHRGGLWFR